jgi:hypothetical protein
VEKGCARGKREKEKEKGKKLHKDKDPEKIDWSFLPKLSSFRSSDKRVTTVI